MSTRNFETLGSVITDDLLDENIQSICNELDALLRNELELTAVSDAAVTNRNIYESPTLNLCQLQVPATSVALPQPDVSLPQPAVGLSLRAYTGQPLSEISAASYPNQYLSYVQTALQPQMRQVLGGRASSNTPVAANYNCTCTTGPKVNFQYMQTFNRNAVPLISAAVTATRVGQRWSDNHNFGHTTGATRKPQKSHQKCRDNALKGKIAVANISVDFSLIGLNSDGNYLNAVVRLFNCFREMHYYLNDVIPTLQPMDSSERVRTFPSLQEFMAPTMSVQQQVKQAMSHCNVFIWDMQNIMNANKMYDLELYLECEQSLIALRRLMANISIYRRMDLEHKRGKFVSEKARAHAVRLELLIMEINDQIRETHIFVHVFNWAMIQKYNPPEPQELYQRQQRLQLALYEQQHQLSRFDEIWSILEPGDHSADVPTEPSIQAQPLSEASTIAAEAELDADREPLRFVG